MSFFLKQPIVLLIFVISFSGIAQTPIDWGTLADVKFENQYVKELDAHFPIPEFGDTVKALNNKEVIITGYVLAVDKKKNVYMISKNPMASCFFCGGSGPETIMEVQFKEKISYETDDIATLKGVLVLNKDDVEHTNYMLTEATGI